MKKIILLFALICNLSAYAQSQTGSKSTAREVRRFEGEVGVGILFGAQKLDLFDRNCVGATFFYTEGRYNLPKLPLDVGVQLSLDSFSREKKVDDTLKSLLFQSWHLMAVSDYNFRRAKKISFFAGIGLGYARLKTTEPIGYEDSWMGFSDGGPKSRFCVMPRVGVEFFHRLRLTLDYKIQERSNRYFNASIGVVFGGGKKE